ncbi:FecR family protein [Arcticibacter tournemirensis]|uniref:DUF4974 domain-containing protein n=1 Tax=Arcticibacter tournemirensis TaxID=699437 RepID=A0A5M9GXW7_9SPHI|nr:FecR family protein [Arcticibacter tournemirensis]KAA8479180.1 DUF4974 domain-containing protein [Arcticibacter tournemirensis]TQM48467.1 FecR family protein [Arcticibacter tournemirensis]
MKREDFQELIEKYLDGSIDEKGKQILFLYYDELQKNKETWDEEVLGSRETVRLRLLNKILTDIKSHKKNTWSKKRKWLSVAAMFLMVMAGTTFLSRYYYNNHRSANSKKNDILPVGNQAVLILSNGSKIILKDRESGTLARRGNTIISQSRPGQLIYAITSNIDNKKEPEYNTLTTPRGEGYQLVLSDGTRVWLNAESSITFPSFFTGKDRIVSTTGEAYFEVNTIAKRSGLEKIPFIVKTRGQEVKVLGTHFNINAYPEEGSNKTTLLEGSVQVLGNGASESRVLRPGQQASLKPGSGYISVENVSLDKVVAWKDGLFILDETNITDIMKQLERLYDVKVEYEGKVPSVRYTGSIPRKSALSKVLRMLERTGSARFKMENNVIIVLK